MKIVLTSSEFQKNGILEQIERLSRKKAKEISIAVVIDAVAAEKGDKRWLIDGLNEVASTFGGEMDIINLLALSKAQILERLKNFDVIFCLGGSSEWLKIVLDKSGISEELATILKDKVWVGSSAGSMILGRMPDENLQRYIYSIEDFYGVEEYLAILDFEIMPHIWGEYVPKDSFDKCLEWSKQNNYPIYVLSDNAAVVVDGDKIFLVGEKGYKIKNGKILEEV